MDHLRHRLVIDNFSFLQPASKLSIWWICDKSRVSHAKGDARVRGPRVLPRFARHKMDSLLASHLS